MRSLTKTPAQESASADSATSVPASAGITTTVPAQASTSTTESTLSVDECHSLQYKKRVEDKAVRSAAAGAALPEGADRSDCVEHPSGAWNAGREAPRRAVGAGVDAGSDVLAMMAKMLLSVDADADQVTKVSLVVLARTVMPAGRGV
ncbi:hypothetical protein PI124_g22930 [Phytophthora idaei]|nr:hypothetical protein PI124_g22930 [Phytophthora idaei]